MSLCRHSHFVVLVNNVHNVEFEILETPATIHETILWLNLSLADNALSRISFVHNAAGSHKMQTQRTHEIWETEE